MADVTVRPYECRDEEQVLCVWNAALHADPMSAAVFRRRALLDESFDPRWLSVAEAEGVVRGFCLAIRRLAPFPKTGLQPDTAWITALAVEPSWQGRGIGDRLVSRTEELCRAEGRARLLLAPYVPGYFVPGVDEAAYARGLAWLKARGFEVTSRPLAMDACLVGFSHRDWVEREAALREGGIEVRPLAPNEIPLLLGFLQAHMPGDWVRHARAVLDDAVRGTASFDQFVIAVRADEVLGYCQAEGDHFGPFGVRDDCQGQGIGTVLLAQCLALMKQRGSHDAWVVWTSDEAAARVYSRFGFRETRRFSVMKRSLEP